MVAGVSGEGVSRRREKRHAVRKMRVDPSKPPCRGRFQTAISCYGPMAAVVDVMVKRRGIRSRHVELRETSANEPLTTHRKNVQMASKLGSFSALGRAWRKPTYWPCGVRCKGGVNLIWAFVRNLRTWLVMVREKVQAGEP